MTWHAPFHRKAVLPAVAAFAGVALLAACGSSGSSSGSSSSLPAKLSRIASNGNPDDAILISLGVTPAYSNYPPSNWPTAELPYVKDIKNLGQEAGTCGFNMEALAAAQPTLIVGTHFGAYPPASCLKTEKAIAPVALTNETLYPPVTNGVAGSTWKAWTMSLASQIGLTQRAEESFENVDRRAAAIRGQVTGQTVAYIQLDTTSTFNSANQYFSEEQPLIQDLGMTPFDPSVVDKSCTNDPATPKLCLTQSVSDEDLPDLKSADIILADASVDGTAYTQAQVNSFISNPLWSSLPAVKDGHVNIGNDLSGGDPIETADLYSAIEKLDGIDEFYATLSGSKDVNASLTLQPSSRKVCWAVDPADDQQPAGPLTLTAGGSTVTLSQSPSYTKSDTSYQSVGCATVLAAVESSLTQSPSSASLSLGSAQGALTRGAPSVIAGS